MKVSIVRESSMHALSDNEFHNFFKRTNHRSMSPDYKLCIDILKMCIF